MEQNQVIKGRLDLSSLEREKEKKNKWSRVVLMYSILCVCVSMMISNMKEERQYSQTYLAKNMIEYLIKSIYPDLPPLQKSYQA
jgi:hypothetical protein